MGLFVSTTGATQSIPELGIEIAHPTTDRDMLAQFSVDQIQYAATLTSLIQAGTLVWRKVAAGTIQPAADYDPNFVEVDQQNTGPGATPDRATTFKDLVTTNFTHDIVTPPNSYRSEYLDQILNDADEEETGKGFSVTTYTANKVTKILTWESPSMVKKRTEVDLAYSGAFVSTITKKFYNQTGSAVIATATSTFAYNPNNTVSDVNTVVTRP